jgi:hypothetical protein
VPASVAPPRPAANATTFIGGVPMKRATKVLAGDSYSSCGGASCSMRPSFSSTIWSAIVIASVWSCVT